MGSPHDVLDTAALDRLDLAGGAGLSAAMAALFERRVTEQWPTLQRAVAEQQWRQAALIAHGLAAAAGQLGLNQCLSLSRALEAACDRQGDGAALATERLNAHLVDARVALRQNLADRAARAAPSEAPP